jgi:hypothetical protein
MPSRPWTRTQLDLNRYRGLGAVLIRFATWDSGGYQRWQDFQIDNVLISSNAAHQVWITQGPRGTPNPASTTATFCSCARRRDRVV